MKMNHRHFCPDAHDTILPHFRMSFHAMFTHREVRNEVRNEVIKIGQNVLGVTVGTVGTAVSLKLPV